MARETPSPVEALPWASESSSSTFEPIAASAVLRLIAVVVLPTPPFWLATARMRVGLGSASGKAVHSQDAPGRIALAGDDVTLKPPRFVGLDDLRLGALALGKEPDAATRQVGAGVAQQPLQRRDGAGGDDIDAERQIFGTGVVDIGGQVESLDDGA